MLLIRQLLYAAIFHIHFSTVVAVKRYWIAGDCDKYPDFADSVKEAVWVAGRIAESINLREAWMEEYMQWWFGMGVGSQAASYVRKTYARIGAMEPTTNRLEANLRLHCDNDDRYEAVDDVLNPLSKPAPSTPLWSTSRFYDRANQIIVPGMALGCSRNQYAYTMLSIENNYRLLFHGQPSGQLEDRHTITMCQTVLDKQKDRRPWTWKGFAGRKLELLKKIQDMGPLASHIIMHEFAHVGFLSEHVLTITAQGKPDTTFPDANGRDEHPHRSSVRNGYLYPDDKILLGEKLGDVDYTIMNPDSYAYMATVYRLRDKQWVAYKDTDGWVKTRKDTNLQLKGDWP